MLLPVRPRGATQRFRGYNFFGEHPELMLEWFDNHVRQPQEVPVSA